MAKRKDAGRFSIIYDALHASCRLIDAKYSDQKLGYKNTIRWRIVARATYRKARVPGEICIREIFSPAAWVPHVLVSQDIRCNRDAVRRRPHDFLPYHHREEPPKSSMKKTL